MEDVLASIRRAIDESAQGPAQDRLGGSMAEFRVKADPPAAPQDRNSRRSYDFAAPAQPSQPQGFAGILGRKHIYGEAGREAFKSFEPVQRQPEPVSAEADDGRDEYNDYYGTQLEAYPETAEPYPSAESANPSHYLPLAPPVIPERSQSYSPAEGLLSETSSQATQAAFGRLAETLTRRALGERPIADVTQDMLRGMLKHWLDENLPKLVERLVREEIERVVRRPR